MDFSEYRPRVNGAMLPANIGRRVVVIGIAHDVGIIIIILKVNLNSIRSFGVRKRK